MINFHIRKEKDWEKTALYVLESILRDARTKKGMCGARIISEAIYEHRTRRKKHKLHMYQIAQSFFAAQPKGTENIVYHDTTRRNSVMPKTRIPISKEAEPFGARLARFRQAAGYSQRDLAQKTGVSQRMIAYYEKQPQ